LPAVADSCYLPFEIDAIDPACVPGTGSAVIGGMTPGQMRGVLRVLRGAKVGAIDLMEVSPNLDPAATSCAARPNC